MRRLELDPDQSHVRIQFRYDAELVKVVRSFPGRRWEASAKVWLVPRTQLALVWQVLRPLGFLPDPAVTALLEAIAGLDASPIPGGLDPTFPAPPSAAAATAPATRRPTDELRALLDETESLFTSRPRPASSSALRRAMAPDPRPLADDPAGGSDGSAPGQVARALGVRQLNEMVQLALRAAFPGELWVVGEIVGFDRGSRGRHAYFELVEKREDRDEVAARVGAVLWAMDRPLVERRLREASEPFQLADGLVVRLKVSVDFFARGGRFQVAIRDIDPVFTLGNLALRREAILRTLSERGLLHRNHDLPMPLAPLRVALLTSPDSEGSNDFLHELARQHIAFAVDLFPIRVQGPRLAPTLLDALERVRRRHARQPYDVAVIVRGGGSRTDLAWFDNLEVADAVARLPLKVIVGIGHHRDQGVLDVVAHSEKTPTAAAKLLVERVLLGLHMQTELWYAILERADARTRRDADRLRDLGARLSAAFSRSLRTRRHELDELTGRLAPQATGAVRRADLRLGRAFERIAERSQGRLRHARHQVDAARAALSKDRIATRMRHEARQLATSAETLDRAANALLDRRRAELDRAALQTRLLDPRRILERGFARIRTADGRIATDAAALQPGERLRVEMRDGDLDVEIEHVIVPEPNPVSPDDDDDHHQP